MTWSYHEDDAVWELYCDVSPRWGKGRLAGWVFPDWEWCTAGWCGGSRARSPTLEAAKAAVEAAVWAALAEGLVLPCSG